MLARRSLGALVLGLGLLPATGVQVPDLQKFFTDALGMAPADAATLANQEAGYLTRCSVVVADLKTIVDTLTNPDIIDLPMADVRTNLLPLAYQHAEQWVLLTTFDLLYMVSKLNMPKASSQTDAMSLAMKHIDPTVMEDLYNVLYSITAVNLPRSQAQQLAINLTAAGADPPTMLSSFLAAQGRMPKDAALQSAIADAVDANLQGLVARYSKDGKLYVAKEFQQYYGAQWLAEWQVAPDEKRTAADGLDYRAVEFMQHYPADVWVAKWKAALPAVQSRIARDGKTYTMDAFRTYFGATWQTEWAAAYEVRDLCAGLAQADCSKQAKCQWKDTGDWTTSCVVRPLAEQVVAADVVV